MWFTFIVVGELLQKKNSIMWFIDFQLSKCLILLIRGLKILFTDIYFLFFYVFRLSKSQRCLT